METVMRSGNPGGIRLLINSSSCPSDGTAAGSTTNEGGSEMDPKPTYRVQRNVGKVKYLVSFHDGQKTHLDGSPFFDIRTFKNQRKLGTFVRDLTGRGYSEA